MFQITLQNRGVTNLLRNCDKRTRSTFFASNKLWLRCMALTMSLFVTQRMSQFAAINTL